MISSQLVDEIFRDCRIDAETYAAALSRLKAVERSLEELDERLSECKNAQEVIDAASEHLNNPFFYFDKDYSIIAITRNLEFEYDEEWEFMTKNRYLSPITTRLMKEGGDLEFLAGADEPVAFYDPVLFPFHSINSNIRLNGSFMGRINMIGALSELDTTDMEAMKIVKKHLARLLKENEKFSGSESLKKTLKDILSGSTYSEGHMENILIEADFPVNVIYALYAVDTQSGGDPQVPLYYESALQRVMVGEKVLIFTYGDSLIMIAAAQNENGFSPLEFKLNAFLNAQGLRLGAGSFFKDMTKIFGIYNQALSALKLGQGPFTRFNDILLENLLSYIPDRDMEFTVSNDLYRILDADKYCSFSMLETLKVYIEQSGSITAAADCLYIHKNTMLYRINKIRETISADLDEFKERLGLYLSILLYERAKK